MRMEVVGEEATLTPIQTIALKPRHELNGVTPAWMVWLVKCGRSGCCALAVVDALLWKDAPPIEFSRANPVNMCQM